MMVAIKKIFLALILSVITISVNSQTHMKFMGITMDGNVNEFCEKLSSLGLKKDKEQLKDGVCFKGQFYGEDADFIVHYDVETKNVYSVSVFIIKKFGFENQTLLRDITNALEEKYTYKKEIKCKELYQYYYYIFDGYNLIGQIDTYIIDPHIITSVKESMLSINYTDVENYLKLEDRKSKDL